MKLLHSSFRLRWLRVLVTLLLGLTFVWAWARSSSVVFAGPFGSPLQPAPTTLPRVTPSPDNSVTATPNVFISPLNTPLPEDDLFSRPYYGPPTPGLYVPLQTPSPHPLRYGEVNHHVYVPLAIDLPIDMSYGKKGVGDRWQESVPPNLGTNLLALQYDWYYDWRFAFFPERDQDPQYVRMVFCELTIDDGIDGAVRSIADVARSDYAMGMRGRVWLIYNEPDVAGQCGAYINNAGAAAEHFSQVYDMIKTNDPKARVFGGGLTRLDQTTTQEWWKTFVETLQDKGEIYKLEGMHFHMYPYGSAVAPDVNCTDDSCVRDNLIKLAWVANTWYQNQVVALDLSDRPVWISETGWIHEQQKTPAWVLSNIMTPISQWFSNDPQWPYKDRAPYNPGYDAISWYVTHETSKPGTQLLQEQGPSAKPTELGTFWNAYRP